jgi:hypothetical protein
VGATALVGRWVSPWLYQSGGSHPSAILATALLKRSSYSTHMNCVFCTDVTAAGEVLSEDEYS